MEESVARTLIKLSNHPSFKKLHEKYFYTEEFHFIRANISEIDCYAMWQSFNDDNEISVLHLYENMIANKLNNIVQVIKPYKQIINVNKITSTIKKNLLKNIAVLSDNLFQSERKNHDDSNDNEFLMFLASDFEEFKNIIKKYPYWYSIIEIVLNDTELFLKEFLFQLIKDREYITENFWRGYINREYCAFNGRSS